MTMPSTFGTARPSRRGGGRHARARGRRPWLLIAGTLAVLTGSLLVAGPGFSLPLGPVGERALPPDVPLPLPAMAAVFDLLTQRAAGPPAPATRDWIRDRLGALTSPIAGSTPSGFAGHLPGAPRTYRGGTHLGLDYYGGSCGVDVRVGTRVLAVAAGTVIRADTGYVELTPAQRAAALDAAKAAGDSAPRAVDPLHGRQVWVLHAGGVISRYSHLSSVAADITAGSRVEAGHVLGAVGNSGTNEGACGSTLDAHLHLELYIDYRPAWGGIPSAVLWPLLREVLSTP